MYYIVSTCIAFAIGLIYYFLGVEKINLVTSLLLWNLVFGVGFFGLFNFVGHAILSKKVAQSIGWVSNGFQKELGYVSLGIGINGILCFWFRDGLELGTIIITSIFLLAAAGLHLYEIKQEHNLNIGNTIIILPDIIIPVSLIVLYILSHMLA
jgi:hypothetical protein